jgi:lysyl endopeptidase
MVLRKITYSCLLSFLALAAKSQSYTGALRTLPSQDNAALRESARRKMEAGGPFEFGVAIPVGISPRSSGEWEELHDGGLTWRQRIRSSGALSLNFHFSAFELPRGAFFSISSLDRSKTIGPFYSKPGNAGFWTPLIESDEVVLELQLPKGIDTSALRLYLNTVQHDFAGLGRIIAGTCNLDAVCGAIDGWPQAEAYREGIRSVALYTIGGISSCTGFLVNNTLEDCTPYFITARHCQVDSANAPSMVFYWNYQNSGCRRPGGENNSLPGDGSLDVFNTGAVFRAGLSTTDMILVELIDPVTPRANAWFSGWDINPSISPGRVASVHHAGSEEKRISISDRGAYRGEWGQGSRQVSNGRYVIVPRWDVGTTELGSSGGPLFNNRGLAFGHLRGGIASCTNAGYDAFGWLGASWDGGGSPSTRLKDRLNPLDTMVLEWPGKSANSCKPVVSVSRDQLSACAGGRVSVTVFVNKLFSDSVNLQVDGLPAGVSASFSSVKVAPGDKATLDFLLPGNIPGGRFPIRVKAKSPVDDAQADLLLLPSPAPTTPGIDASLADTNFLSGRPRLRWIAPGGKIQGYKLALFAEAFLGNPLAIFELAPQTQFQFPELPAGQYAWALTAYNDCGTSDPAVGRFALRKSPLPALGDLLVSIDPNPGTGIFNVRFSRPVENAQGWIYVANGQQLQQYQIPIGTMTLPLDLSGSPPGTYFFRLRTDNQEKTFKLLKINR